MSIQFAVFCLLMIVVWSYPSIHEIDSNENENNDLQLELRSIKLYKDAMSKRQGGYNKINPDLKCEIECVGNLRNPSSGQGLSIKEAAKACQNICARVNNQNRRNFIDSDSDISID